MDRDNLLQVRGAPEPPPEEITRIATTEDGELYRVRYTIESIEESEQPST